MATRKSCCRLVRGPRRVGDGSRGFGSGTWCLVLRMAIFWKGKRRKMKPTRRGGKSRSGGGRVVGGIGDIVVAGVITTRGRGCVVVINRGRVRSFRCFFL